MTENIEGFSVNITSKDEWEPVMEYLRKELARLYLNELGTKHIRKDYELTQEEAEAAIEKMAAEREFSGKMAWFVHMVVQHHPANCVELVMNTEHLNWIRSYHQRHQQLGIYTGRRKRPGMDRATPALYGVPIRIDESVTEPRIE